MIVSLELLYHYNCDTCKKWWTIADFVVKPGHQIFCPHCGYFNTIDEVVEFPVKDWEV